MGYVLLFDERTRTYLSVSISPTEYYVVSHQSSLLPWYVTLSSSRPEHTKRTQGNAEQRKATHARQATPKLQIQHQQTEHRYHGSRSSRADKNKSEPTYLRLGIPTVPTQPDARNIKEAKPRKPQSNRKSRPSKPPAETDLNRAVTAKRTLITPHSCLYL